MTIDRALGIDKTGAIVGLQFFVYDCLAPMILSSAIRIYDCERYDDGSLSLRADLSIECSGDAHYGMRIFSGIVLFFYAIVFPSVGIAALWPYHGRMCPPAESELAALNARAIDGALDNMRVVFASFRPHLWCAYFGRDPFQSDIDDDRAGSSVLSRKSVANA